MASASTTTATKRKRPAFSPPRPKTSKTSSANKVTKAASSNSRSHPVKTNPHKPSRLRSPTPSESDSTAESTPGSASRSPSLHLEPDYILAEVTQNHNAEEKEPSISLALLHTLLNHHFNDKDRTRISRDAKAVIGKYMDTFMREAIARSALERQEKSTEDAAQDLSSRGDDGWLEVEDLEKMAPQLVLDF